MIDGSKFHRVKFQAVIDNVCKDRGDDLRSDKFCDIINANQLRGDIYGKR